MGIAAVAVVVMLFLLNGLQCHAQLDNIKFHDNLIVLGSRFNAMIEEDATTSLDFGKARNAVRIIALALDRDTHEILVEIEHASIAH